MLIRYLLASFVVLGGFIVTAAPINVAVLSGQSKLQQEVIQGIELATDHVNDERRIADGKIKLYKVSLSNNFDDNQNVINKIAKNPSINFVISTTDQPQLEQIAPSIIKSGKLLFSTQTIDYSLLQQYPKGFYPVAYTNNVQAGAAAQFIAGQMHFDRVLILYQNNYRNLNQNFVNALKHYNGTVLADIQASSSRLAPGVINQIRRSSAEVVYLIVNANDVQNFIEQIRKVNSKVSIVGNDNFVASEIRQLGKKVADNIYFTTHGYYDKNFMQDNMQDFIDDYADYYHHKPETIYPALGYDTIDLIKTAINKAKTTNPAKVAAALNRIKDFEAVTGDLNYTKTPPTKFVTVVKILNAKPHIAAMVLPQYIPK